jgi:hypothetical protein
MEVSLITGGCSNVGITYTTVNFKIAAVDYSGDSQSPL